MGLQRVGHDWVTELNWWAFRECHSHPWHILTFMTSSRQALILWPSSGDTGLPGLSWGCFSLLLLWVILFWSLMGIYSQKTKKFQTGEILNADENYNIMIMLTDDKIVYNLMFCIYRHYAKNFTYWPLCQYENRYYYNPWHIISYVLDVCSLG